MDFFKDKWIFKKIKRSHIVTGKRLEGWFFGVNGWEVEISMEHNGFNGWFESFFV